MTTLPPNRHFGLLFATVFGLLALWAAWRSSALWVAVFVTLATLFAVLAWRAPQRLAGLNRAWMRLGAILGAIISPIVLGVMFFVLIAPVALLTRAFGRDALRLKKRAVSSYWIERDPPGPEPESFRRQF